MRIQHFRKGIRRFLRQVRIRRLDRHNEFRGPGEIFQEIGQALDLPEIRRQKPQHIHFKANL